MLRSILVGLDGSPQSASVVQLGIDWARRFDALLVGLGIVDEPTIARERPVMLGGPPHADPVFFRERTADARRRIDQFLEQFALRCAGAGIACKVLEDVGLPCERIMLEAQRYDLILLGQRTRFHFETSRWEDDTVRQVPRQSPRPVLVVPEGRSEGLAVVVAYNGSPQASRTLHAAQGAGLCWGREVHVVTVHHDDRLEAARRAERAVDYLGHHEIKATAHPLESQAPPAKLILEQAERLGAGLLVAGAYGQSALRELMLGSVTASLLQSCPIPLFLYH
jgi:nucleotide-binding universal stress UspA family protein